MTNTLRDDVVALAAKNQALIDAANRLPTLNAAETDCLRMLTTATGHLREILSRHPDPGDSVVVPRELMVFARECMDDILDYAQGFGDEDDIAEIRTNIAQADAILGKAEG